MASQAVSNEAALAHGGTTRRTSAVWTHFEYLTISGGTGTSAMATCRRCGSTLRANTKKHGTSQLWRHAKSGICAERAAGRVAACLPGQEAPAGDGDDEAGYEDWINDLLVEAGFDGAGRLIIEGEVLAAAAGDHERRSSNSMPDVHMPQVPASSSMRFFQKKRARSAYLVAHGTTTGNHHSSSSSSSSSFSSVDKDSATTGDGSMMDTHVTFGTDA